MIYDHLCLINTDKELNFKVLSLLESNEELNIPVVVLEDIHKIEEFLKYEMPETVLINFSDKNIDIESLMRDIVEDSWLHRFGIIGFYDEKEGDFNYYIQKFIECNILHLIEINQVNNHLIHILKLIERNIQILFQKDIATHLIDTLSGAITLENDPLSVPCCVNLIVNFLFQKGYIDSEVKFSLTFGLREMVMNAIEHGNCGISCDEKHQWIEQGGSVIDLIFERNKNPEIKSKQVHFDYEIGYQESIFRIEDQGLGFNWKALECPMEEKNAFLPSGRGIYMTKCVVDKLKFNEKGNIATLHLKHKVNSSIPIPDGFSSEEVITFHAGDEVFTEGEKGDYIYYISSGNFAVYHDNHQVSTITPADIFMGEMSFLLNCRRSATVKALTSGKLVRISKNAFINAIQKYPYYGMFLSKILAKKLLRTNHVISLLG